MVYQLEDFNSDEKLLKLAPEKHILSHEKCDFLNIFGAFMHFKILNMTKLLKYMYLFDIN